MDGEKAGAVGMDGQPPPYTSPQHQANAAAGEGIAYIMSYNAVMTMSVIIILTRHTIVWKDAVCCFLFCFFVSCFLFFFLSSILCPVTNCSTTERLIGVKFRRMVIPMRLLRFGSDNPRGLKM